MTLLAVVGPTASGKSEVAVRLARRHDAAILSVDSMQVYRDMDIGTAKPGPDLREEIDHHMIDLVDPGDDYTVARFQRDGRKVIEAVRSEGRPLIIVGGSGLHLRALIDPMTFAPSDPELRSRLEDEPPRTLVARLRHIDPEAGRVVDLDNPRRVLRAVEIHELTGLTPTARSMTAERIAYRRYRSRIPVVMVGIDPGPAIGERITRRFDAMLDAGLADEVAALAPRLGRTAAQAVGYKELLPVVAGRRRLDEARDDALRATRALAKRQRTYFRPDPRIHWITWSADPSDLVRRTEEIVEETSWTS